MTDPMCPRCHELDVRIASLERQITALERSGNNANTAAVVTSSAIPPVTGQDRSKKVRRRHRVRLSADEEERQRQHKRTRKAIIRITLWVVGFLAASSVVWWTISYLSPGGPPRN